jgi:NAD(P)-dependent dehydrogenase (short-subunit alcohol dehydrogenase family)
MNIDLSGRIAIVTGAGGGLGREYALLLARLGAKVVVNDLGTDVSGKGSSSVAAQKVADEILAAGGQAFANGASVSDFDQVQAMVRDTVARWGKVDILVNNAGILRDRTFAKMDLTDFRAVLEVHLMGSVHCTKAVWNVMRAQNYGRIVMTTSSSGLYGNFGQSNYGAAKLAIVGLMQTLALEGAKSNIRVNCIAPSAATRMLEGLVGPDMQVMLHPRVVSPAIAALVADNSPTRTILCAGAGSFEVAHVILTKGIFLGTGNHVAAEILERLHEITDIAGAIIPSNGWVQSEVEFRKASENTQAGPSLAGPVQDQG